MIIEKMMPIKFKPKSLKKLSAFTFTERVKKDFKKVVSKKIVGLIVDRITSGQSTVARGGKDPVSTSGRIRFEPYSESYKDKMGKGQGPIANKRQRPVNLSLSGKMLRSIKTRLTKKGVFVFFTDPKAKYHNELGAGKRKVIRRLLPKEGERWEPRIRKFLTQLTQGLIREQARKKR